MIVLCEYSDDLRYELLDRHLVSEKYLEKYQNEGVYFLFSLLGVSINYFYVLKETTEKKVLAAGCIRYKISKWSKGKSPWLYGIVVAEELRGNGYGEILVRELLNKIGDKFVYLLVDSNNKRAISLYDKIGFMPIGSQSNEIIMRKQIC